MKHGLWFILLLWSFIINAHEDDEPINYSSELLEWCQAESEAYYVAKNITPYNWSASWWEVGNIFYVKGYLLVNRERVDIECRIAKGAKKKYAVFEIKPTVEH